MRVADLVEAEGRSLRAALRSEARSLRLGAGRLGMCVGLVAAAAPLLLLGLCLMLAAAYLWLEPMLGQPGAALVTGLITLAISGGLLWTCTRAMRP